MDKPLFINTPVGMTIEQRVGMAAHQVLAHRKMVGIIVDTLRKDEYLRELGHYPSIQIIDVTDRPLDVGETTLIRIAPGGGAA